MQFRHSDKAKDLNHSICSFHRPCEWNKQLPFPRSGWQKCLWLAKNPGVDVHSNPSSTRGAWRYYRFYFDHSWTFLHEQGFLFCVCICQRKDDQSMLSSFFKAYKHHMLPSAVQGAPQKKKKKKTTYQSGRKESKSGVGFFSFITISLLWCIRPEPPRQLTWISVLFWSFMSPSFMSPTTTHCPHREVHQAGTGSEQSRHGSGTGLKELSCDLREVPSFSSPLKCSS